MKTNEITPLTQLESGQLTGGFFTATPPEQDDLTLYNNNCSESKAMVNKNCGCKECNPNPGQDKPVVGPNP